MPTTNPVPSQDPSDLLFNAGKLDEVLNGTSTSFTDRLGTARRTVAGMNADFDAQLADAESDLNVYRADAAASAAQALGYLNTIRTTSYGAYASDPATDPLGNTPNVGDEYFNTTSNLLKRWNGATWQASDINTANLAASSGSSLVGHLTSRGVATIVQQYLRSTEFISNNKIPSRSWKSVVKVNAPSSIQAAIDAITDAGPNNVYLIIVGDGAYTQSFVCKDYVDVIGESKDGVSITYSGDADTANISGRQMVLGNMTLIHAQDTGTPRYALHADGGGIGNPRSTVSRVFGVRALHYGSVTKQAIGIGIYGFQQISFNDVDAESSTAEGIFAHNIAGQNQSALLDFTNVRSVSASGLPSMRISNQGSGMSDVVTVNGGEYKQGISVVNAAGGAGEITLIVDDSADVSEISSVGNIVRSNTSIGIPSIFEQYLSKAISLSHYQMTFNGGGPSYRFPIKLKYQLGASGGMQLGCTSNGTFELQAEDGTTSFLSDSSGFLYNNGLKILNKAGSSYVNWASRNAAGTAACVDLNNIGEIVTNGAYRGSGNFTILNKAGNGWLTWAARSTSGADAEIALTNIQKITSSRLNLTSIPIAANNSAAISAGLTAGEVYRTNADPSVLCVVV